MRLAGNRNVDAVQGGDYAAGIALKASAGADAAVGARVSVCGRRPAQRFAAGWP